MLVNIGDVSGGQNRHITAGLEYGDSAYIWVGQASVSTKATLKTMEVCISISFSPIILIRFALNPLSLLILSFP